MPREGRVPEAAAAVERTGMEGDCSCIIFTPDIHVGRTHSAPAFEDALVLTGAHWPTASG